MSLSDVLRYVDEINKLPRGKVAGLGFTGGEPMLELDLLVEAIKRSKVKGAIITNGFWGRTPEMAREVVKKLASTGKLPQFTISTDIEHQEFVPIEYVKNAISAVIEAKAICKVNTACSDLRVYEKIKGELLDYITTKYGKWPERRLSITYMEVSPDGRGADYELAEKPIGEFFYSYKGCFHPTIMEDGSVRTCACDPEGAMHDSPLILGNAKDESLAVILDRSKVLTSILSLSNVFKILVDFLEARGLGDRLKDTYPHRCALCRDIFNNPELVNCIMANLDQLSIEAAKKANIYDVVVELRNGKRLLLKVKDVQWDNMYYNSPEELKRKLNDCVLNVKFGDVLDIENKVLPISILTNEAIFKIARMAVGLYRPGHIKDGLPDV